jgi:predicted P-loop ATPase
LNAFEAHYDPTFDVIDIMLQVTGFQDDEYHKEFIRTSLIGPVERSYRPGCYLGRIIILAGPRDFGKSTLCKLVSGDADLHNPVYYTDEDILLEKNLVTRYAFTNGKAMCEDAERAAHSRNEIERLKKEATKIFDARRPLWKNDSKDRQRWYDIASWCFLFLGAFKWAHIGISYNLNCHQSFVCPSAHWLLSIVLF